MDGGVISKLTFPSLNIFGAVRGMGNHNSEVLLKRLRNKGNNMSTLESEIVTLDCSTIDSEVHDVNLIRSNGP